MVWVSRLSSSNIGVSNLDLVACFLSIVGTLLAFSLPGLNPVTLILMPFHFRDLLCRSAYSSERRLDAIQDPWLTTNGPLGPHVSLVSLPDRD